MGFLFTDGFDSYAATADLTKKWRRADAPWAYVSNGGRNGGGCMQAATTSGGIIQPVSAGWTTGQVTAFGFWFKMSAAPAAVAIFLQSQTAAASTLGSLRVTAAGKFALYNASSGLIVTGATTVTDNNWHWVELYYYTNNNTNKLYVDQNAEWNGTLANTSAGVQDSWWFQSILNCTITLDDVMCWNDDVASNPLLAALPLGPRQITTVRPQADSVVNFLSATGGSTHYNQVNETVADGDTSYVESAVSGDQDLYDFAALGISPATITSVVANAYASNPNPGSINMAQVCKSNATTTVGSTVAAPSSYRNLQQSFPLDPNTAAAWASASAIDAATFGPKVI